MPCGNVKCTTMHRNQHWSSGLTLKALRLETTTAFRRTGFGVQPGPLTGCPTSAVSLSSPASVFSSIKRDQELSPQRALKELLD